MDGKRFNDKFNDEKKNLEYYENICYVILSLNLISKKFIDFLVFGQLLY